MGRNVRKPYYTWYGAASLRQERELNIADVGKCFRLYLYGWQ
jgi:hypothetical protein